MSLCHASRGTALSNPRSDFPGNQMRDGNILGLASAAFQGVRYSPLCLALVLGRYANLLPPWISESLLCTGLRFPDKLSSSIQFENVVH